ncbi:MAG: PAS domain S-box protein [Melioribacteraceae bacterium]|jgi:two-component system NtrC family sensor kinase|nr:PAS domain S-box protein [Melioribacteraceae bacterium]
MKSLDIKSFLAVPFVINKILYGFIAFDSNNTFGILSKKYLSLYNLLTEVVTNLYSRYLNESELIKITDTNRSLIQAVEQSANSVVITDVRGNIEYVNPKFVERTGYSYAEVIGQNSRILKSGHTPSSEYEILWKTISLGKSWKGQFKNIDKHNNIFWEQATISPIINETGIITQFLAIKEDITEKLLQENQRSLSNKMESIGQLAAGIAHEINTPMQYVGDNANFLADSYSSMTKVFFDFNAFLEDGNNYTNDEIRDFYQDKKEEMDLDFIFEEVPEALEQTKIGIEHVTKIVKAMKDFAHPGAKEKAYFDLNKGLQNTVAISKNEWKYVAEIDLNLDESLTEILCLQNELNQVFLNMIVNSAHAIEEKNKKNNANELGKITIETKRKDQIAFVKFSDTGSGIKKKDIDRIFDPFFTTKEVGKGTGQGLAIVHDIIVNKHNGKIFVESEEGIGTSFNIELPLNEVKEQI